MRTSTVALPALVLTLLSCAADDAAPPGTPGTIELAELPGTLEPPPTVATEATTTTPPPTTLPPTTTAPPTTLPPTTFLDDIAAVVGDDGTFQLEGTGFAPVTDDTGRLTVLVPDVWPDRSTAPGSLADGAPAPYVAAAPELTLFLDSYETAGLALVVLPPEEDTDAALEDFAFADDCDGGESTPFTTERLVGEYEVWTDCGETGTDIVVVGAQPADAPDAFTAVLLVQVLTDFDVQVLAEALDSLEVRDEADAIPPATVSDTSEPDDGG